MSIPAKAAAVLAAALLALTVTPTAAQAAPDRGPAAAELSPWECPANAVCLWRYPGFDGPMAVQRHPDRGCHELPNGPARSIYNRTDEYVVLFVGPSCEGEFGEVLPGDLSVRTPVPVRSWAFFG